jgi:hypothetical protein
VGGAVVAGGFVLAGESSGLLVNLGIGDGPGSTAVIGRLGDLAGSLGPNGSALYNVSAQFYSLDANMATLEKVLEWGKPIRDLSGAVQAAEGSVLALERGALVGAGWILSQAADGFYYWIK